MIRKIGIVMVASILCVPVDAQQEGRKTYTLEGTVTEVNAETKRIGVVNDPVPGGMGTMTMTYPVANGEPLAGVRNGDRIRATMHEGDTTLYDLQVVRGAPVPASTGAMGLSMEDLERMALENNPTVAQAEANARIAAGVARQAGLYPNPRAGYYGDEIRGGYSGGGKQGGFISQTIVTGGKLAAARRAGALQAEEAKTEGALQRFRIVNNVRMLFYEVLGAQRLVEVRQDLSRLAEDAAQTSRQLANVGQADRPDVLQAEVEQQQANLSLRIARQTLIALWRNLAAVVGKPDLPQTHLNGDMEAIPDLNYEACLAAAMSDSPEIKLAAQRVERAEAMLTQAKKASIPDLELYGNLSQNYEPLETTGRPIGLNGGVQIGVQLPIFNRNQGGSAAAKSEVESARAEAARVRLRITRDLAELFSEYDAARATVQQYKSEMLPRAEEAFRLYRANYQNMAAAYPQALMSQRTLFQLRADYAQALTRVWQSSLSLRGFGTMDGLAAPGRQ